MPARIYSGSPISNLYFGSVFIRSIFCWVTARHTGTSPRARNRNAPQSQWSRDRAIASCPMQSHALSSASARHWYDWALTSQLCTKPRLRTAAPPIQTKIGRTDAIQVSEHIGDGGVVYVHHACHTSTREMSAHSQSVQHRCPQLTCSNWISAIACTGAHTRMHAHLQACCQ